MDSLYHYRAHVLSVYDGDTCTVRVDVGFRLTAKLKLRLSHINAPEIRGATRARGLEVRDWLRKQILDKDVVIMTEKTGNFGRWLAVIWPDDRETFVLEESLNAHMVRTGRADVYKGTPDDIRNRFLGPDYVRKSLLGPDDAHVVVHNPRNLVKEFKRHLEGCLARTGRVDAICSDRAGDGFGFQCQVCQAWYGVPVPKAKEFVSRNRKSVVPKTKELVENLRTAVGRWRMLETLVSKLSKRAKIG